ncbi:MAG TPA: hypothetical protein VGN88_01735 [Phycisphaerae bacterium]
MAVPKELVQLRLYLMQRAAYCIVYRVCVSADHEVTDVQFYRGFSVQRISHEKLYEIAALNRIFVLEQSKLGKSGFADETIKPSKPQGRLWRGLIVASGPTRAAGYAVLAKILAKDDVEMVAYGRGVQQIMQGKDARDIPRPGGW